MSPKWVHFQQVGKGDPVILLHGVAASRHDWKKLAPYLANAGYRVYAADLLGHGESYKPDEPDLYTVEAMNSLLEQWIDSLELERPPFLVGHSLGGYFVLDYALLHPERVRGLALIDPFYSPEQIRPLMARLYQYPGLVGNFLRLAPLWALQMIVRLDVSETGKFPVQVRHQIALDIKRASPHIMRIVATAKSLTPQLNQLATPAVVIWGEKDQTLNPASYPPLVSSLPDASGFVVPASGHQPHLSQPKLVNQLVLDFFHSIEARQNGNQPSTPAVDAAFPAG